MCVQEYLVLCRGQHWHLFTLRFPGANICWHLPKCLRVHFSQFVGSCHWQFAIKHLATRRTLWIQDQMYRIIFLYSPESTEVKKKRKERCVSKWARMAWPQILSIWVCFCFPTQMLTDNTTELSIQNHKKQMQSWKHLEWPLLHAELCLSFEIVDSCCLNPVLFLVSSL